MLFSCVYCTFVAIIVIFSCVYCIFTLKILWVPSGPLWERFGVYFRCLWGPFGSLWGPFGSLWAPLGSTLGSLWRSLALVGNILEAFSIIWGLADCIKGPEGDEERF